MRLPLGRERVITAAYGDAPKTEYGTWGFDTAAMDKSVKPGDDFFMYANGNWYKTAQIPPDRASTGSFQNLRILSEKRMQEIAASLDAKPYDQLSAEEKKLRDLYDAFVDQKQIDAKGLAAAKPDLDMIAQLKTLDDVAAAMGDPRLQLDGPVGFGIGIDDKNPNAYSINLGQSRSRHARPRLLPARRRRTRQDARRLQEASRRRCSRWPA